MIFVSDSLRRVFGLSGETVDVIPCSASECVFFFDPALRCEARRKLGYEDTDRVAVYSGSLEFYQCFPESVASFRRLREAGALSRLLVVTPEVARAEAAMRDLPAASYRVVHAPFERVNEYLNAADVAFMLRRPDPLNLVASPTKFAEYCLTGLPIVMGNSIEQSYSIARELGNIVELANGGLPAVRVLSDDARRDIVEAAHRRLSRSATRLAYARSYGCSSVAGA